MCYQPFSWMCLFFSFFPRASDSKWRCLKTGERKTRDAGLDPKTQKGKLEQNVGENKKLESQTESVCHIYSISVYM